MDLLTQVAFLTLTAISVIPTVVFRMIVIAMVTIMATVMVIVVVIPIVKSRNIVFLKRNFSCKTIKRTDTYNSFRYRFFIRYNNPRLGASDCFDDDDRRLCLNFNVRLFLNKWIMNRLIIVMIAVVVIMTIVLTKIVISMFISTVMLSG